jgi:hypothetical protein
MQTYKELKNVFVDNTEMKMYSINNGGNMMINNSFLHLMG